MRLPAHWQGACWDTSQDRWDQARWDRVLTAQTSGCLHIVFVWWHFAEVGGRQIAHLSRRRSCLGTEIMRSHQVVLSVSGNFFVVTPLECLPAVPQGEFHAHPNHSSHQSENGFADDAPNLSESGAVLAARRPPCRRRFHSE